MARFRKIDPRIWFDERFRRLSASEKLVAVYVLTAQSNRIGLFHFSRARAAEDLEMLPATFAEGFARVCETLRWAFDESARVLFLPTWFRYNRPENPNVLKACLADLHEVPETPLRERFAANLHYLPETFHKTFREGLSEASGEPWPNQEQEQEQEKEQEYIRSPGLADHAETKAKPQSRNGTSARPKKRKPKVAWPEDLKLTPEMRARALAISRELGFELDPEHEFSAWKCDALANGRVYANWQAAWENRVRRIPHFSASRNGGAPLKPATAPPRPAAEVIRELLPR